MSTRTWAASADLTADGDGGDPLGDLAETMSDAGRTRRILHEALDRRTMLRRALARTAALAGFASACSTTAMRLDIGSWTYLLPASILLAVLSGSAALALLILDRSDYWDGLTADEARCGTIIRQIQALRQEGLPAEVGDRFLRRLLDEFKTVADRHKGLDGLYFIPQRRHPRLTVRNRNVTCTLRNGEQWSATIRDMSRSGVALKTDMHIGAGTVLMIGSTPARAVRVTPEGMAFTFLKPFSREHFSLDITL